MKLARKHRIIVEPELLRPFDLAIPIGALDEANRDAPGIALRQLSQPAQYGYAAPAVGLNGEAETGPPGEFRLLQDTRKKSQRKIKRESIADRIQERYHRALDSFRQVSDGDAEYADRTTEEMETELSRLRELIAKIEDVNLGAIKEYEQLKERFDFLTEQRDDLVKAVEKLVHRVDGLLVIAAVKHLGDSLAD